MAKRVRVSFWKKLPGGRRKRVTFMRDKTRRRRKPRLSDTPEFAAPSPVDISEFSEHIRPDGIGAMGSFELSPEKHRHAAREAQDGARRMARMAIESEDCRYAVRAMVSAYAMAAMAHVHERSAGDPSARAEEMVSTMTEPIYDRCVIRSGVSPRLEGARRRRRRR